MTSTKPYLIRAMYDWMIDNNLTPYIAVDATIPEVIVPQEYIENDQIILDISTEAANNLIINNDFLEFKARFDGPIRNIHIPLEAIMAIYAQENDHGMEFSPEEFDNFDDEEEYSNPISPKTKSKLTLINCVENIT
jgi:stringent starvation protein B